MSVKFSREKFFYIFLQYVNLCSDGPNATLSPTTIPAHRSDIARMVLSKSASFLATGSTKVLSILMLYSSDSVCIICYITKFIVFEMSSSIY